MNVIGSGSPRKVPKARRIMRSASERSPSLNGRTETSSFTSTIRVLLSQPALVSRLFLFHHKQGDTSERQVQDSYALFLLTTGSICELPIRLILGNPHPYARIPIRYRGVGKRACSPGFLEEFFSETVDYKMLVYSEYVGQGQAANRQ